MTGRQELQTALDTLLQPERFKGYRPNGLQVEDTASVRKIVACCPGGAQNYFETAFAAGADAFINGEISGPQAHVARESGVAYDIDNPA